MLGLVTGGFNVGCDNEFNLGCESGGNNFGAMWVCSDDVDCSGSGVWQKGGWMFVA